MDKTDGTFPTVAHPTDTTQGRTQGGTQEDKYDLPIHSRARSSLEQDMNPEPNKTHTPSSDSDSGLTPCQPAGKLAGKIAIITGGESGIGRAIAILFALEGARVVISYPREKEEDAQNTKAQVEKNEGEIHLIASDLTQAANCTALVNQVIAALGGIDILVNNAAIRNEKGDIADITYGAAIVNSASADAYIGTPSRVDYAANKEVVIAFTRALSNQLVKKGIRVNAVAIGPVWPSLVTTGASEQDQKGQDLGSWTPMEQLDEIATSYVFLAGNESTFMSGQTLHPNGGIVVKG